MQRFSPGIDLSKCAFVHDSVCIYGKLKAEKGVSFWPYVVARSEMHEISIGAMSNIQDFVMIHVGASTGTHIGKYCSITHHCTLHGCTIGDYCLIGINSTIMDGCVIGNNCIIAGHTFLKEGTVIPDNSIVMGTPGKVVKTVDSARKNKMNAVLYYKNALAYAKGEHRAWSAAGLMQDIDRTITSFFER